MPKTTFEEHSVNIELEQESLEEWLLAEVKADYTIARIPPDFSADNDQDFCGTDAIVEVEYFCEGAASDDLEDIVSHIAEQLRITPSEVEIRIQNAIREDACCDFV